MVSAANPDNPNNQQTKEMTYVQIGFGKVPSKCDASPGLTPVACHHVRIASAHILKLPILDTL
jgi:hypothetical protein